ncbi:MAG: ABC transporter ATP-binding protein [Phycisphaerae bacterium]|jgi:ABC-type multidrug transport system fused ATPase/permease subunit|nr:ABC transporter ATP-binding protein [Phycisphaerae bacterium]
MKDFFRALRYLKPYRKALGASILCVLIIAVLWAGGIGMIIPAMKVLISPEGLHGWAWNSIAQDRIQAKVDLDFPTITTTVAGKPVTMLVDVVRVDEDSHAHRAGILKRDWIIGVGHASGAIRRLSHENANECMALMRQTDKELLLEVFTPGGSTDRSRTVTIPAGDISTGSGLLGWAAGAIPQPRTKEDRFPILIWALVIIALMTIMRDVLRFCQEYIVRAVVLRAIMDMRCENYNVALRLPATFFAREGTSDTTSRFIQDTGEVSRGMMVLFGKTLVEPAKALASLTMAMILSWEMTLLALAIGPPAYFLIRQLGRTMKKATRRALEGWSAMLSVLEETLAGIRVVKAYTMEGAERKRFFQVNRQLLKQQKRIARTEALVAPSIEAMGITAAMVAVGLAGYRVLTGQLDTEIFIGWMALLVAMFDPIRKLAKVSTTFQRADAAAVRIFQLQDKEQEKRVPDAPVLPVHSKSIEFRNVRFQYPGASDDSLQDINLTIDHGETVAVVGPNGSGKTTLVSLLPRLIDPTEGAVLIDGCDVCMHSLRSLRKQISVVTQETVLFNATIAENIAYGERKPSDQAVKAAAKRAFIDEFISELPDGYDTMVGQRGATLSGGQRQRITIARAILRDPAILIFDEAMSQIDSESEHRIHEAMEEFSKDRTTLLIAHRFATVLSADRIVVIGAGRIHDIGPHSELLERCKLYKQLYETQFVDSGG